MVEGLHQSRADQSSGVHDGRRKPAELVRRYAVSIRGVDHDLAVPVRSLGKLILQSEGNGQDNDVGLERVLQRTRGHCRTNRLGLRYDRLGRPPARHGHLNVLAGFPLYLEFLEDRDPETRIAAAEVLSTFPERSSEVIIALVERIHSEKQVNLKAQIVGKLQSFITSLSVEHSKKSYIDLLNRLVSDKGEDNL